MKHSHIQKGFTLIELVVVIVILGILAAVALPKFIDMSGEATQASVDATAGAVSSAAVLNYAKYSLTPASATRLNGATPCATLIASANTGLVGGALPTNITITTDTTCASVAAGGTVICTLSHSGTTPAKTANAQIICTN
jgi:MSHA pilin protein MshA